MKKTISLKKKLLAISFAAVVCGSASVMATEADYSQGQAYLDQQNWNAAINSFSKAVSSNSKKDAALYWLAYAQHKANQNRQALQTLRKLSSQFSNSRWLDDGKALEAEINGQLGKTADISQDEMKLYAINSLMNSDSERAYTILEKLLNKDHSNQVKKRALFVLSQSNSEKAFSLIASIAEKEKNPELQMHAVEILGIEGSKQALTKLKRIYEKSTDNNVKDKVISSLMIADDYQTLISIAKLEKNDELKAKAINMIGVMEQPKALYELYQLPSFSQHKSKIVDALAISEGVEQIEKIIEKEDDESIVLQAVNQLGIIDSKDSVNLLAKIYKETGKREIKSKVLSAYFIQSNAKALIKLAKSETDNELKRETIKYLSMMDSEEAVDFFSSVLQ